MKKKIKDIDFPMVLIEWRDTTIQAGWVSVKYAKEEKTELCKSIGFLLEITKQEVKIASAISLDKETDCPFNALQIIPTEWIKKDKVKSIQYLTIRKGK